MSAPSITVAYVMKGFFGSAGYLGHTLLAKKSFRQLVAEGTDDSEIDAVGYIASLADLIEEAWQQLPDGSYSGAWDYEISEPFGDAVAEYAVEYNDLPSVDWARTKIQELIMKSGSLRRKSSKSPKPGGLT